MMIQNNKSYNNGTVLFKILKVLIEHSCEFLDFNYWITNDSNIVIKFKDKHNNQTYEINSRNIKNLSTEKKSVNQ